MAGADRKTDRKGTSVGQRSFHFTVNDRVGPQSIRL